ncbi:MAG TPA: helix-turn-helix transcriptional regulator, partial [Nocardioides sp.]
DLTTDGLTAVTALFSGSAPDEPSPLSVLTAAERQVADRVADGLTSRQIADDLFVSPRTVDAHLTHIYRKLDISSRARLAAMVVSQR